MGIYTINTMIVQLVGSEYEFILAVLKCNQHMSYHNSEDIQDTAFSTAVVVATHAHVTSLLLRNKML